MKIKCFLGFHEFEFSNGERELCGKWIVSRWTKCDCVHCGKIIAYDSHIVEASQEEVKDLCIK